MGMGPERVRRLCDPTQDGQVYACLVGMYICTRRFMGVYCPFTRVFRGRIKTGAVFWPLR